jgi:hypothetical protein
MIGGLGHEAFNRLDFRALERGQLAEFDDPLPAQGLRRVLVVQVWQVVRKPWATRERTPDSGLARALQPFQDANRIRFAARFLHPGHRRNEGLAPHRTGIPRVLCMTVRRQPGIKARRTVPGQPGKIVTDRMVGIRLRRDTL